MGTTFQELNVGDEFSDDSGVKYRKTQMGIATGSCTNAMVISHQILAGLHVAINLNEKVNKIVKMTKFGDMKEGDVFVVRLPKGSYYKLKLRNRGCFDITENIFHANGVCEYYPNDAFEVVGHIDLTWPKK